MPAVVELHDQYVVGKRSRGFGRHLANEDKPEPEPIVTLVAPGEINRFIGARDNAERLRHLKHLRDEGILIHRKGNSSRNCAAAKGTPTYSGAPPTRCRWSPGRSRGGRPAAPASSPSRRRPASLGQVAALN